LTQILELDREKLVENFAKRPFAVKHNLVDHPLLTLDALADLADRLPEENVEHNLGDVPDIVVGGEVPKLDQTPGEVARGIESNGCWMVIKRIQDDAPYRELLEQSLDEVVPHVADKEGGYTRQEGFVFLSAPNSVTPAHLDPEHNLLLQIRGSKAMTIGSYPDAETEQREVERYFGGGHRNLAELGESQTFDLQPRDGVYVPTYAPHVVHNGPEVSISFSITFFTEASERDQAIHSVNSRLRKLGMSPAYPGEKAGSDRIKAGAWNGLRKAKQTLSGG
jgi:hypothetical protein